MVVVVVLDHGCGSGGCVGWYLWLCWVIIVVVVVLADSCGSGGCVG